MTPSVDVFLARDPAHDVLVGRAHFGLRRGRISASFTYDASYLAAPGSFAIDPALPLREATYHTEGLFGCMRDSAPDRWGRHLVARRIHLLAQADGVPDRSLDEVDYLLGTSDATRQGALRYSLPLSHERLSAYGEVPPQLELPRLVAASNEVMRGTEGIGALKELLDAGSGSLGGARPKASVADGHRLLLAKFSHPGDEWAVMAWEKTALDLAGLAGLQTPRSQLVTLGRDAALLLERFDRDGSRAAGARIPYLSAMTLVEGTDGGDFDYLELAEKIPELCSSPTQELRELFKRIALSIALHNTDDHLRNTGFVRTKGSWHLSPCFDINPNPRAADERVTAICAETGAGEAKALAHLAADFGLTSADAAGLVREVLLATAQWQQVALRNGCPRREVELFERSLAQGRASLKDAFGI